MTSTHTQKQNCRIDAGNMGQLERFHTDLQQIFVMLQCKGKKEDFTNIFRETESILKTRMWKHSRL